MAHFGESSAWSVGAEEEVMILDAETLLPAPAVLVFVEEAKELGLPGVLATELHASIVELKTGICSSAGEAAAALGALRRAAAAIAARHGLRIAAAGSHPIAQPEELVVLDKPRYHRFVEYAGVTARRQGVSGLHVHVGMPNPDACFQALEGVLPWLPLVLALSANSPYLAGEETGLASNRAEVLAQLPRSGAPPAFQSYAGWQRFVERFRDSGVPLGGDYTSFWWDVRPHPRFGTLELRMPDQPTALRLSGAFIALLQALCANVLGGAPRSCNPAARGVYQQNRWAAARYGAAAELMHPEREGEDVMSVPELAAELIEMIGAEADELGSRGLLDALDPRVCEADLQLEVGRARGLEAVCADLVERTAV